MENLKRYYQLYPDLWNGYEVGELLGSGSFGDVYVLKEIGASNPSMEAFKEVLIPPASAGGLEEAFFQGLDIEGAKYYYEGMKKKALEEVNIMKHFSDCPNIVQFKDYQIKELPLDTGLFGWVLFVRMELLQSFKEKFFSEGMTLGETIKLGIDLCTALEACHTRNILHRDIKPENIFYSPLTKAFKLGDFGISCYMSRLTEEKGLAGTLTHMAPEIYQGKLFDYEADLYAVGMILYKLLNGNRIPFLPDYPEKYSPVMRNQAIRRRLEGEEVPLPSIVRNKKVSSCFLIDTEKYSEKMCEQIAQIAHKAIAAKRTKRYKSAEELKLALMNCVEMSHF